MQFEIAQTTSAAAPILFFGFIFICFFVYDYYRLHTKCPQCQEAVKKKATVCKHCGAELTPKA